MTRSYPVLVGALAFIWGASYLFIKEANKDFSPPAMMEIRLLVAALILLLFLVAQRGWTTAYSELRAAGLPGLVIGVFNGAIPFTLIAWGEHHIDSGIAAIANATVPIFTALLAPLMLPAERPTGIRLGGFVLGLVGVGVLSGVQPHVSLLFVLGTLAVVVASLSYGIAALGGQRRLRATTGPALATVSMIGGALALLPLAVVYAPTHVPQWKPYLSLAALTVLGTALAQLIWYRAVRFHGASRVSLVTYLMPPVALFYGAVLLGEPLTFGTIGGLFLILVGVALGSGALRLTRAEPVRP